jgi:hypothetical protein
MVNACMSCALLLVATTSERIVSFRYAKKRFYDFSAHGIARSSVRYVAKMPHEIESATEKFELVLFVIHAHAGLPVSHSTAMGNDPKLGKLDHPLTTHNVQKSTTLFLAGNPALPVNANGTLGQSSRRLTV